MLGEQYGAVALPLHSASVHLSTGPGTVPVNASAATSAAVAFMIFPPMQLKPLQMLLPEPELTSSCFISTAVNEGKRFFKARPTAATRGVALLTKTSPKTLLLLSRLSTNWGQACIDAMFKSSVTVAKSV
jgi:hypothetical protein